MIITAIEGENVLRLKAFRVEPKAGRLVPISGRNGAGKSSLLRSVGMLLGWPDDRPIEPVRRGEDEARLECTTDSGITVKLRIKGERWTFSVQNADGSVHKSPRTMMRGLSGGKMMTPEEFGRMRPAERVKHLRDLLGLDFSELDADKDRLLSDIRDLDRDVKHFEAAANEIAEEELGEPIDIGDLSRACEDAAAEHERESARLDRLEELKGVVARYDRQLEDLTRHRDAEIERLKKQIAAAEQRMKEVADEEAMRREKVIAQKQEAESQIAKSSAPKSLPDLQGLRDKLAGAQEHNRKIDQQRERVRRVQQLKSAKDDREALRSELASIDERKKSMIAGSKFPVQGVSFEGGDVCYDGFPWSQVNCAMQIRLLVAMHLSRRPELPVICIEQGPLLDDENLGALADALDEFGGQAFVEVQRSDLPGTVVIENGEIVCNEESS